MNLLGPDELGLVLLVVFLDFFLGDADAGADLLPDHTLGEDLVADAVSEVLVGRPCFFSDPLLELLLGGDIVLPAKVIHVFDKLGLHVDVQLFAALSHQALVHEVAQDVLLVFGEGLLELLAGNTLAGHLGLEFRHLPFDLRAGDDLAIDLGDDFLDHADVGGGGRQGQGEDKLEIAHILIVRYRCS